MPETSLEVQQQGRSETVRVQIMQLKSEIATRFLKLGRLLKEARDNEYALTWGYRRFGDWVEEASGLDMSERNAYYFINVIEGAERLGIPDSELEQVKFSSLKEIFSLPADTDPERVRELFQEAKTMRHKDVREVVGTLKNQEWVFHTHKHLREVEDNVYQPAMERARREFGSTISPDGHPEDITDSRCAEMIYADYIAGAEEDDEIVDAEFTDVIAGSEETESAEAAA